MNKKELMILLTITFTVIILWVISSIVHAPASEVASPELQQALTPLDPNFDQSTLDQISKK